MSSATIALRRNQNFARNNVRFVSGPVSVGLMLMGLVILLSLLYLNQITKTSVFNYKISNLQAKRTTMETQKQKLEIEAARLQSLTEVKAQTAAAMIKTDNVSFATK